MKGPKPTLLERLTGSTIEVEVPEPSGQTVRKRVSKKWFDAMVAEGKIRSTRQSQSSASGNGTDKPLHDQAKRLVGASQIVATSSFSPLLNVHPFLRDVNTDDWDFFITAATVCMALMDLVRTVDQNRFGLLLAVVVPELREWNPRGEDAVRDCQQFVMRATTADRSSTSPNAREELIEADAVGMWVLWNLFRREPSYDEAKAARAIGGLIAADLRGWWDAAEGA